MRLVVEPLRERQGRYPSSCRQRSGLTLTSWSSASARMHGSTLRPLPDHGRGLLSCPQQCLSRRWEKGSKHPSVDTLGLDLMRPSRTISTSSEPSGSGCSSSACGLADRARQPSLGAPPVDHDTGRRCGQRSTADLSSDIQYVVSHYPSVGQYTDATISQPRSN